MACLSGAATGCGALPSAALEVAESATTFEVMAVDPGSQAAAAEDFHGHRIVWRTLVTDPAVQERILGVVNGGISRFATQARCFNPRHGVRVSRGARTVDIVICYECGSVHVHDGETFTSLPTTNVQPDLDEVFDKLASKAPK